MLRPTTPPSRKIDGKLFQTDGPWNENPRGPVDVFSHLNIEISIDADRSRGCPLSVCLSVPCLYDLVKIGMPWKLQIYWTRNARRVDTLTRFMSE